MYVAIFSEVSGVHLLCCTVLCNLSEGLLPSVNKGGAGDPSAHFEEPACGPLKV